MRMHFPKVQTAGGLICGRRRGRAGLGRAEHPPVFLPIVAGGRPAAECAPSYPSVCIPPYPPDEHHLDADNDGIACESP